MSPLLRELSWNELAGSLAWFSALLVDAVEDGASVGFLPPLSCGVAGQYWMEVAQAMKTGGRILIAAYMEDTLVGSVQVDLATKPNALHRAEIQKLVVHRQMRRRGIGRALMGEAERLSREAGRTLLILDT
ncbi:MAG: GNAT family N-acetyltransferase, partial [Bryobacteraceae bacterium]